MTPELTAADMAEIVRLVKDASGHQTPLTFVITDAVEYGKRAGIAEGRPKDHLIREAINELTDISIKYQYTQQLRDRIARVILNLVKPPTAPPAPE